MSALSLPAHLEAPEAKPVFMTWQWQAIFLAGTSRTRVAASLTRWAAPVYAYSRYVRLIVSHFAPG
jgi:hypothetical protein